MAGKLKRKLNLANTRTGRAMGRVTQSAKTLLTVTFIVLVGVGLVFAWGFIVNIVVFAIFAGLVWVLYKIFR